MIIKNYLVNDMYEAMVLIKQELGNDAVIVSKREVRKKGVGGIFKKKMLEVTAATDVVTKGNGITKKQKTNTAIFSQNQERMQQQIQQQALLQQQALAQQQSNRAVLQQDNESNALACSVEEAIKIENNDIKREVKEIKEIIEKLVNKEHKMEKNEKIVTMKDILIEMDFHNVVIQDFEKYYRELGLNKEDSISKEVADKEVIGKFIKDRIDKKVNVANTGGRIRTFIGPTGVGKTTTIAKLVSNDALLNQKDIGLITIDTYRIGAVEQLKIYANILGIPLKTVFSPDDLPEAIDSFKDKDLIYIDSTGRNHKNVHQLNEIKSYLDKMNATTYLVLSLGLKNIDFVKSIENYKKVGFDNVILTKLDETYSAGNILNTGYFTDKPISNICKGQVVPDDIEEARKGDLLEYVWGDMK